MLRVPIILILILGLALLGCTPSGDIVNQQGLLPASASPVVDSSPLLPEPPLNPTPETTSDALLPSTSPITDTVSNPLQPLVQAPRVLPYGWSPDSTFFAYWIFSEQEVAEDYLLPPGQLHFLNAHTKQTCKHPWQVGYFSSDTVWLPTGQFLILTDEQRVLATTPCTEQFTELTDLFPGPVGGIMARSSTNSLLLFGSQDGNWLYLYEPATSNVRRLEPMAPQFWRSYGYLPVLRGNVQ